MMSPSLNPNSPALSASKSYKARQHGLPRAVGDVTGDGRGETAGAPQASPKAGLFLEEAWVGDVAGDTPGDVEIKLPDLTGNVLLEDPGRYRSFADKL